MIERVNSLYHVSGIEVRQKGKLYPVLVSLAGISEMEDVVPQEESLRVGAAVTLSDLETALKGIIKEEPGTGAIL